MTKLLKKSGIQVLKRTCILSLIFSAIVSVYATGAPIDDLRNLWRSGDYKNAAEGLLDYQFEPYGKNLEVYYMIGTSFCQLEKQEIGRDYLDASLKDFNPSHEQREVVLRQRRLCIESGLSAEKPIYISFATTRATAGINSRSKMFYFVDRDNAVRSIPVKVVREIPVADFLKRLFPRDQAKQAVDSLTHLAGTKARVVPTRNFIIASLLSHSEADLQKMGTQLDLVFDYFVNVFGMRPPESFISVYLVSSAEELSKLAESVHGIKVASQSLGYSYRDDLSMVGYVPSTGIGTLRHELFHLMVRNNFGNIPPWMDEGLAALFEVAKVNNRHVFGISNWRGEVLKKLANSAPSVRELVNMSWVEFEGGETEQSTATLAAIHAKARYLMLFLQEQDKLVSVYQGFQQRKVGADAAGVLENILGKDLELIEAEFQQWFSNF